MKHDGELLKFTDAFIINLAPVPQKEPFYDATGGPFTHSKISKYVELYTEDGIKGVCPCSSIMERTILPLIMTGEKKSFGQWMHKVYWSCRNSGFDGETAGEVGKLEYLLTDILAKRADMPFHRFLGALKDSVTVYGSGGSTHLSGADLAGEMEHFMDCGHKTVKMKVGTDFATKLDCDVERVRLVRETLDRMQSWPLTETIHLRSGRPSDLRIRYRNIISHGLRNRFTDLIFEAMEN